MATDTRGRHRSRMSWLALLAGVVAASGSPTAQDVPIRLAADRTRIEVGETVTFTLDADRQILQSMVGQDAEAASSGGTAVEYVVVFGDGEAATALSFRHLSGSRVVARVQGQEVAHVYGRPGTFQAVLRLVIDGTLRAESAPVAITVSPKEVPVARLTASPAAVVAGERVVFSAQVEPRATGDLRYAFTFGDGNQQVSRRPRTDWVYRNPGRYVATVRVERGGEPVATSERVEIVVEPAAPPPVRLAVRLLANPTTLTEGGRVVFTAATTPAAEAGAYEYLFEVGEGSGRRGPEARVTHGYGRAGAFTATVLVLERGEVIARSAPVTVVVTPRPPPPVDPPAPERPVEPGPAQPDPVVEEPPVVAPPDVAPAVETPTVRLRASTDSALVGEPVDFTATASGGRGGEAFVFLVDGQAVGAAGPSPRLVRAFGTPGTAVVAVRMVRDGETVAESAPVRVEVTAVPAAFVPALYVRPERPRRGEPVSFWTGGVPQGAPVEYRFHFGDGTSTDWLAVGEAEHVYAAGGEYNARVEVRAVGDAGAPPASGETGVTIAGPSATVPLWLLAVVVAGALVLFGWRKGRRARTKAPAVHLDPRADDGTAQVAEDRPLAVDWEIRVRPVADPGRSEIETPEAVLP